MTKERLQPTADVNQLLRNAERGKRKFQQQLTRLRVAVAHRNAAIARAVELRALLVEAREHLFQHSMEYKHPGQPDLIARIDAKLSTGEEQVAP